MALLPIPTTVSYVNSMAQPVIFISGANTRTRKPIGDVRVLAIHDTDGVDSRGYLRNNIKEVSSHYLVGKYKDRIGVQIYKYASEASEITYTQGYGTLGGIDGKNINDVAISVEIEFATMDDEVRLEAAKLCASIIRYWDDKRKPLVMLPHYIVDDRKVDPRLNWRLFCRAVYAHAGGL